MGHELEIVNVITPEYVGSISSFEQKYEQEILPFVKGRGHASCTEMMRAWHLSYTQAVRFMDILEERGIVDIATSFGPRALLNGRKKSCPLPATTVTPNLLSTKASEPTAQMSALPGVASAVPSSPTPPTPVRKRAKIRKGRG